MTTTYDPRTTRRHLKSEAAEFAKAAIENARNGLPQHEGSRRPTGRTIFYFSSSHEAVTRWVDLAAAGWKLDTSAPCLYVDHLVPLSYTALCPDDVFESYLPLLVENAERDYALSIEAHNKQAAKLQDRADFIKAEFERLEEERKAQLLAEIEAEYDRSMNPRFVNSAETQLHA